MERRYEEIISSLVKVEETRTRANLGSADFWQIETSFPIPFQRFATPVTGLPINNARSPGPVPSDKNSHVPVPAGPFAVNKSERPARIPLDKADPGSSAESNTGEPSRPDNTFTLPVLLGNKTSK